MTGHDWKLTKSGKVDTWAYEYEYHNGPECLRCRQAFCEHCEPECYDEPCPAAWVDDFLATLPDDWRRGPAIRRWMARESLR